MGLFASRRGSVDEAVLAELRAIRAEIHELADRVASAAQRSDLDGYVTLETYNAHLSHERSGLDTRRWWANYGLMVIAAIVIPSLSALAVHLSLIWR